MTVIPDRKTSASHQTLGDADAWGKMMALAGTIEKDQAPGAMTIRNGKLSLTLRLDGGVTVRDKKYHKRPNEASVSKRPRSI